MTPLIACNLNSYRQFRDTAYEHLARVGLRYVEIPCPEPHEAAGVRRELAVYGLAASGLMVRCQLEADDAVLRFTHALDTVAEMGVHLVFTSVRSGEIDLEYVYGRLQSMGDAAAERDVVVVLETHPDLVTNAEVGLRTMQGVNHPNIRVNFDTANVYFYNEGVTAVGELERLADWVGAVHLKDTNGGYRAWHFPALGEGVVDFLGVFRLMEARGFEGPYTLELEGIRGEELTREIVEGRVEKSLAYLREQGLAAEAGP